MVCEVRGACEMGPAFDPVYILNDRTETLDLKIDRLEMHSTSLAVCVSTHVGRADARALSYFISLRRRCKPFRSRYVGFRRLSFVVLSGQAPTPHHRYGVLGPKLRNSSPNTSSLVAHPGKSCEILGGQLCS